MLVLLGWQFFFAPAPPPPGQSAAPKAAGGEAPAGQAVQAEPAADQPAQRAAADDLEPFQAGESREITVSTPRYSAVFNSQGGVLVSHKLADYAQTVAPDSPRVALVGKQELGKAPMGLLLNGRGAWREGGWRFTGQDLDLAAGESGTLTFEGEMDGMRIKRELTFDAATYLIRERLLVLNTGAASVQGRLGFSVGSGRLSEEGDQYNLTRFAWYNQSGRDDESGEDDMKAGVTAAEGLKWAAVDSNYFLAAAIPGFADGAMKAVLDDGVYRVAVEKTGEVFNAGVWQEYAFAYYYGPKVPEELAKAPNELSAAIDYGWFDFIAKPLLVALNFFHQYVNNYGVAIIILTIIIKIVFWPLSHKSYKSMESMKKIQPMMQQVRDKYKDDREKMNQEMMQLYKTYKVNPAGGCLPMLLQIPVFIGLYQALLNAIELRHASFIATVPFTDMPWLVDLSAQDPYYVTPIVMGATMFLQQKMTPSPGDPMQAKIMLLMPVVFTFLFLSFPAGLVVYWLVNNVLSIAQQWFMLRKS